MGTFLHVRSIRKNIKQVNGINRVFPSQTLIAENSSEQFVMQSDRKQESNTIHRLYNKVKWKRYHLLSITQLPPSTYECYLDLTQIVSSNKLTSTAQSLFGAEQCIQNHLLNYCSRHCSLSSAQILLNDPPAQIEQKRQKEVSCSS